MIKTFKDHDKDHWTIPINGPWRLIFNYNNGHLYDVWLAQYR